MNLPAVPGEPAGVFGVGELAADLVSEIRGVFAAGHDAGFGTAEAGVPEPAGPLGDVPAGELAGDILARRLAWPVHDVPASISAQTAFPPASGG